MKLSAGQRLVVIKDWTYRTNIGVGTLPAGNEVAIEQVDQDHHKFLVYFGNRDYAWMDLETIQTHCRSKS